jgi:hypothetical protein
MAVREALHKNKAPGIITAVVLLAVAGTIIAYTYWPRSTRGSASGAFYSDDEGKTFFSDSIYHFPPYDQDGKTVYGAVVYTGNSGKFVGALYRFTPDAKKTLESSYAKTQSGTQPLTDFRQQLAGTMRWGVEYRLPSDSHWALGMPRVKAPDGGDCFIVMP